MVQVLYAILYNSSLFLQSETQTALLFKVLMCKLIHLLILYCSEVFDSITKKKQAVHLGKKSNSYH